MAARACEREPHTTPECREAPFRPGGGLTCARAPAVRLPPGLLLRVYLRAEPVVVPVLVSTRQMMVRLWLHANPSDG